MIHLQFTARLLRNGIPALVAGMLVSCTNDLDRVAAVEVPVSAPDRVTHGAEYLFSDSGVVRNRLRAGRIEERTEGVRRTTIEDGLELTFFGPDGSVRSVLTARRGSIDPEQRRMAVQEAVVFVNEQGERLETEELVWMQDSALVRTDRPVRVVRRNDVIHGEGLTAAEDMSRYTIRKITGILELPADDTLAAP